MGGGWKGDPGGFRGCNAACAGRGGRVDESHWLPVINFACCSMTWEGGDVRGGAEGVSVSEAIFPWEERGLSGRCSGVPYRPLKRAWGAARESRWSA